MESTLGCASVRQETNSVDIPDAALTRNVREGLAVWTDPALTDVGITVAFTERTGGVSIPPFDSLNLAAHVGDVPDHVDENRTRVLAHLGLEGMRGRLVTAEQVHGSRVRLLGGHEAGRGAFATKGRGPVPGTDALVTVSPGMPLMMFFADCVPLVLVSSQPVRGVAIVHAGWKGALARIPERAARVLCDATGCDASALRAYIGPYIGLCCYPVDETRVSRFCNEFDTIAPVDGGLDIGAAVRESLADVGIEEHNVAAVDACTFDNTGSLFSYRSSSTTGRHAALVAMAKGI